MQSIKEIISYLKWRIAKRKFHIKDEADLSQKEKLDQIIANGKKIKVKYLDDTEYNRKAFIKQSNADFFGNLTKNI